MKKIIISFLVLALMSGCKSSLSNSDKANKYVLLFSNDKAETFDTSSFVYYNAAGEITSEDDFDGTLFTQLTEYKNKLIANNGQEIVESTNGKVKTIKYKKQLDAYFVMTLKILLPCLTVLFLDTYWIRILFM